LGTREQWSSTEAACGVQRRNWIVGKQTHGADAQPVESPDKETVGCNIFCMDEDEGHTFSVNHCGSHGKSDLDTISLNICSRDTMKLKFLLDKEAEISLIRSSSLTRGVEYQLHAE